MSKLNKRNPLAKAVRNALLATTVAAISAPTVLLAEEAEEGAENRVQITGSRIKQTDIEGPTPITVIDREQIDLSGQQTIADVIRTTTFNSFGSFRERSGSSFGQAAQVDLRGLGASHTAVLINGRRVPGSPIFGSSAANLNSLPLSAVERVEILSDGASAVYGADAIAGVINIILRSDYDGAEIEFGAARPKRDGGDEESGSFTVGHSSEKGNIVFSTEFFRRDAVFDRDRSFSQVQINGPSFADTIGISVGGNTGFNLAFTESFPVGDCETTDNGGLYAGVFTPPGIFGTTGSGCGFGYADVSKMTGDVDRANTFLSANYEITDDTNLYIQNSLSRVESSGRYAPAVGFFRVDGGVDANANGEFTPNGEDFYLFHRFVGHGPRDETFVGFEIDTVVGVEGVVGQDIDYDAYYRVFETDIKNLGRGYTSLSSVEAAVANNSYDFVNPANPANAAAITATAATLSRDLSTSYKEASVNFSGYGWDFGSGEMGWSVGADWADEIYTDLYDSAREAGDVIGSAGNSSQGERERYAVFGEIQLPITEELEVRAAVRYDDYSDFGNETSPQMAILYRPMDELLFRASFGEGFKAPDLTSLNSAQAESFNNITDFEQCAAQGIADDDCPTFQVRNLSGGNPNLEAETADTFNFGVVAEPVENLTLSLDIWSTELKNAISQISLQQLLSLQQAGSPLPSGTSINRAADISPGVPGRILFIQTGFANVATLEVNGFDLKANYSLETEMGRFRFGLQHSNIDEYIFTSLPGAEGTDLIGTRAAPEYRTSFQANWSMDDHTVALDSYYIPATDGSTDDIDVPAFTNINLTYVYNTSWDADITFGIRNLADKDPSIDDAEGWTGNFEPQLYDVYGRTPFFRYTQRF